MEIKATEWTSVKQDGYYNNTIILGNPEPIKSLRISLKNISIKDLVNELISREGVGHKRVEPYVEEIICTTGPAILITVID